jgi:ubiquinone/menaquinone biosynthesis C-methylase UbiE
VGESATTREWRRSSIRDPLHAVASWQGREGSWSEEEFYRVGRSDWADFFSHWRHYERDLGGACVEIGCGAGRITASLAEAFGRVVGLDVSREMINRARRVADAAEFHLVGGTEIPLDSAAVDAAFTSHVLQHLDSLDEVGRYLREVHRVLRPGGTGMIHLPITRPRRSPLRELWFQAKLLHSRRTGGTLVQYRTYPPRNVRALLEGIGFADIELREFRVRSNEGLHSFWLVRRPA